MAAERKTQKVMVWVTPEQAEWLKGKKNVSETVRAMIAESMSMDQLALSVKKGAGTRKAAPAKKPSSAKKPAR